MNKKIKVIELINKVYANLDVPEKVKYKDKKYKYNKVTEDYESEDGEWLFPKMIKSFGRWTEKEVEILEDEEEINIEEIEELQIFGDSTVYDYNDIDRNRKVINELVKAVKQLNKEINKED